MELTSLTFEERLTLMRKRYEYFSRLVGASSSFDDFIKEYDEQLAIGGIELSLQCQCIFLYVPLGFSDYEGYHIIQTIDGGLIVSPVIAWQNNYCANDYLNIFTGKSVEEDEIFSTCITK